MVIVMFGAVGLKYHYIREERSEGGEAEWGVGRGIVVMMGGGCFGWGETN